LIDQIGKEPPLVGGGAANGTRRRDLGDVGGISGDGVVHKENSFVSIKHYRSRKKNTTLVRKEKRERLRRWGRVIALKRWFSNNANA